MRELRHDFRAYYHVAYDDVPPAEAVDLIRTLPPGSLYRAALDLADAWSDEQHFRADVVDQLNLVAWRLLGCPGKAPRAITRPADVAARREAARKAREVRERIGSTRWEAVEDEDREEQGEA